MRRYLLLLLALSYCACATSRSAQSSEKAKLDIKQDTDLKLDKTVSVTQGPVWEFDFALPEAAHVQPVQEADNGLGKRSEPQAARERGGVVRVAVPHDNRSGIPAGVVDAPPEFLTGHDDGLPEHGPLLKAIYHGPIVAQTALQATAATETHAAATKESEAQAKSSMRPAGLLALWPLLPVAIAVLAWFKRDLLLGLVKKVVP